MNTHEKTYVDHCHFNDNGNRLIAQNIARLLWGELSKVNNIITN